MTLIPSQLASVIENSIKNNPPTTSISGKQLGKAVSDYFDTAQTPGQGTVNTKSGMAVFQSELGNILSLNLPQSSLVGKKIGIATNNLLSIAVLSGGLFNTGPIVGLDFSTLGNELGDIFSKKLIDSSIIATKLALAFTNFAKSGICQGTGFPPTIPPQIGPLV